MSNVLLDRVLKSPRLPSLPSIAIEVIDLVQQQDVNIKQIANTIQHDPALSTKILKTVNSSFYGQSHSISTISHALVVLGLNSVKTLALGFSLVANLKDSGGEGFDHIRFWKRCLYSAVAARSLAKQLGLVQQEEAFLGGLLQDMGMLALNQTCNVEYQQALRQAGEEHQNLIEVERQVLGIDHAQVGGALASKWNLPPLLTQPILYHHDPSQAPADVLPLVQCVSLGGYLGQMFSSDHPADRLDAYLQYAKEWFNIPPEEAESLIQSIHKNTVEMRRLFALPTGQLENPDEILARANETLTQLSLQQQRAASELVQQNRELVEQATTDSLTGAANRRRFNEFITQQFDATTNGGQPFSLLFMDVDHFKKFNDTYGHQLGDRVLAEVANVLKSSVESPAMVARYGGEEFAVILPGFDRIEAARMAETLRLAISQAPVESDEGQILHVTASIGVATYNGTFFSRVDQLIKAADQGVYAAKKAGRNSVRVFAPRIKPQTDGSGPSASNAA